MAWNRRSAFIFLLSGMMVGMGLAAGCRARPQPAEQALLDQAYTNGLAAQESFERCHRFVQAWLKLADPVSGLLPTWKGRPFWNAKDAASDNYPFMVLTAAMLDQELLDGPMRAILETEKRLTSRLGNLPDTFDFRTQRFMYEEADLDRIMFGSAEYAKDGLLTLAEWMGPSPWRDRLIGLQDDMWKHALVDTPSGPIISTSVEINGDALQTLVRTYWITGDRKYLDWALRLGDFYLLGHHHPTRDSDRLRLRDHGSELIPGLCELYATVQQVDPAKKQAYQQPLHEMLDRILEVGRNAKGMFYNIIDPIAGVPISTNLVDTWGYNFSGYYTVYLIDGTEAYREAALKLMNVLNQEYRNHPWEMENMDGYADAIESALYMYNREPVPSLAEWMDSEIKVLWQAQKKSGLIDGRHCDGNFARTSLLYAMWKTQGLTVRPWRPDVVFGAVNSPDGLRVTLRADQPWEGVLVFDEPRHRTLMGLPFNWPRVNYHPEWFTVVSNQNYQVRQPGRNSEETVAGVSLRSGLPVALKAGRPYYLHISAAAGDVTR